MLVLRCAQLIALSGLLSLLGGCGSVGAYCEEAASCEGGNDEDIEACSIVFEDLEEQAGIENCSDDYDAFFECLEEGSSCNEGVYNAGGACEAERGRLDECLG